jgi:uncharacterized protein
MTDTSVAEPVRIRICDSLATISAADWDACAIGETQDQRPNPFVSHAFLVALERSGCVGGRTGWLPMHVIVDTLDGAIIGAAPCYLKLHSQGEYVFDHAWADAIERAGGQYYPKLQVASPFSPVTGPRLLARAGVNRAETQAALIAGLKSLMGKTAASSVHVTFATEADAAFMETAGFLQRRDQQFHWENNNYNSFDDFLEALNSRKRKTIKRERRDALANGISIRRLTGSDITEADWDAFFAFYIDTGSRKWGRPYLNRAFFSDIGRTMADDILLIMADREGKPIAGAINFIGHDTLFGRNWGCTEDHPFLHFEVCYYQAIDFAIERGLKRVEAGAQGEHKLARGYMPSITYSCHEIANPSLRRAVEHYLDRERQHVAEVQKVLAEEGPYRHISDNNE